MSVAAVKSITAKAKSLNFIMIQLVCEEAKRAVRAPQEF